MSSEPNQTTDLTAEAWQFCRAGCGREWGNPCAGCLHLAAAERIKERGLADAR